MLFDDLSHLLSGFPVQETTEAEQVFHRGTPGLGGTKALYKLERPPLELWRETVQIKEDLSLDGGIDHI
jgi:hypothetical protein